ncbi:unnamed protein product [Caenorhabditis angaria]|uniref:Nitrilase and fragile histidine triad fusion protein NitFhit n=1 Tax=Caenorhabditis angaria TaxID=860376 RepID=A0A9P1IIT1_9PELO|nr:unnamed protein product [Caenorhabditis angaria]
MTSLILRRTMATGRHFIAVCQMTSDHDLSKNFETAKKMIERAGEKKCEMVFFPECFDYIGRDKKETIELAMSEKSEFIQQYRQLAKKHNLWLSLGGLHHADPNDSTRPWNSHLVIDSNGETRADYRKLHLFDLEIPGKLRLMESEFSKSGDQMIAPIDTPIGKLGLSICYDVRFAELALFNRKRGAQVLSYPSAFTLNTGLAHWETLLRARAIETQCYVVAAAQTGKHNEKRQSYGHAMIIDPWGAVIAQCSERVDMAFAEIDLDYVAELREMQPVFSHRRNDLYSLNINEFDTNDSEDLVFSTFPIKSSTIFVKSQHSFAFVNLKPVTDGHVLVSPKRVALRLTDLSDEETADLFVLAKKVQKMIEKFHGVNATTICVQDGKEAGQTVPHVHIHILPRRVGDFGDNEIYQKLATHDKEPERRPRNLEEMSAEAKKYRDAFQNNFYSDPQEVFTAFFILVQWSWLKPIDFPNKMELMRIGKVIVEPPISYYLLINNNVEIQISKERHIESWKIKEMTVETSSLIDQNITSAAPPLSPSNQPYVQLVDYEAIFVQIEFFKDII